MTPETCPNCGADVPKGALACPECGSDAKTGWAEEARTAGLDLPDEDFDYDEFARREFGKAGVKPEGIAWFWWVAAILVLAAILTIWLR